VDLRYCLLSLSVSLSLSLLLNWEEGPKGPPLVRFHIIKKKKESGGGGVVAMILHLIVIVGGVVMFSTSFRIFSSLLPKDMD
jgi:hypothetical protein